MKKLSALLLLSVSASCFAMQTTRLALLVRQGTHMVSRMRGAFVPTRSITDWQTEERWEKYNKEQEQRNSTIQSQEPSLQKKQGNISTGRQVSKGLVGQREEVAPDGEGVFFDSHRDKRLTEKAEKEKKQFAQERARRREQEQKSKK